MANYWLTQIKIDELKSELAQFLNTFGCVFVYDNRVRYYKLFWENSASSDNLIGIGLLPEGDGCATTWDRTLGLYAHVYPVFGGDVTVNYYYEDIFKVSAHADYLTWLLVLGNRWVNSRHAKGCSDLSLHINPTTQQVEVDSLGLFL